MEEEELQPLIDQQFDNCILAGFSNINSIGQTVREALESKANSGFEYETPVVSSTAVISDLSQITTTFYQRNTFSASTQSGFVAPISVTPAAGAPRMMAGPSSSAFPAAPPSYSRPSTQFQPPPFSYISAPSVDFHPAIYDGRFSAPPILDTLANQLEAPPASFVSQPEVDFRMDWFLPPSTVVIDTQAHSCYWEKEAGNVVDLSPLVLLKEDCHKKLFRPKEGIEMSADLMEVLTVSIVFSKPVRKDPVKPPVFDLLSASLSSSPNENWEITQDRSTILVNLSQSTKRALELEADKFEGFSKRDVVVFKGLSDPVSSQFFDTINAPVLSTSEHQVGGPYTTVLRSLEKTQVEADARRRSELSSLVQLKEPFLWLNH